jgi:hypothetical protein
MNLKDLYWLAGILEGEGSFGFYNRIAVICVQTTDKDVIERICRIMGGNYTTILPRRPGYKVIYNVGIRSTIAIGWMFTLYSLMGARRKNKILDVIRDWKACVKKPRLYRQRGSDGCYLKVSANGNSSSNI